ncbi:MAG: hypothetical protein Crog4KO_28540 [Crocinitomicaceae bacterium]
MHLSKHIFIGAGIATIATALLSFQGENHTKKEDDEKKKKYHVIHQKDGEMHEYDTIIPMNSSYSVDDFLADKGIDDDNVKVIEIPSVANMAFMSEGGDDTQIFMHKMDEDVIIKDENGKREEIKIIREENKDGEVIMKKFVNGEEVEVTDEDMKELHFHQKDGGEQHIIIMEDGENLNWTPKDGEENVEIKVEMDDEGNTKIQKFVNGEEVEVSEEELEHIQNGKGNVFIFEEGDGNAHIDMDSIMKHVEMEIEMIEEGDMEEGQQRVIIKEIRMDGEELNGDSKEIKKEIRMQKHIDVEGEGSEDFTVVLVHENYDEAMEEHMQVRVMAENDTQIEERDVDLNEPISVYPNPNNGTFTIAFSQKNEVKTSIRVVDTQGKVVFKEKLGAFSGSYKKELDLKKHGAGVFVVTVQQGDETSSRKVIVE